jgi:hypothetical protein
MDLATARRLLLDPRALTIEQWREAYLAVQEHNIRGGGEPHPRVDGRPAESGQADGGNEPIR